MEQTGSEDELVFDGIGMTFPDGTEALRGINLSVRRNEFATIVGPSGCGKSTLLYVAAGLLKPTSGKVTVESKQLGFVQQDANLLPWRTVQKNVELLMELHKVDSDERNNRASDAIETVALKGFENHYPKSLSGGMKMRASLARTLTMRPPVFLFDEPFGALDEVTRQRLNEETQSLFQSERFAGLFITHSINEAVFMSTTVHVMSARPGRIVATFEVPFEYPRQHEIRFTPEFAELGGEVSKALRASYL